ncbi:hypothetical protein [Micromonospora sp. NPDC005806]|uniref:hypothetical protein n=1 Tax=Micromonospora sp. NPDC005806 TaxID=3364234 RepID=UPI0036AAA837
MLVDARTGRPLSELDVGLIPGPAASEPFRARLADAAAVTQRWPTPPQRQPVPP